jgi:hypothetical protein
MGLLDGQLAEAFAGIFGAVYLDGQLYRPAAWSDDGQGGGADSGFGPAEAVKVQIDQASQAMRQAERFVDTDVRILMLAHGVASPDTDCEVAGGGARYMIQSIGTDPAGSYYEMRGRPAPNRA